MKRLHSLTAIAAPLLHDNVDTDSIIPVPFLRTAGGEFGRHLFHNLRYNPDGSENDRFVLNRPPFRDARILVSRRNFGCGSSREQAVWALQQFGFEAILAESFGDIFRSNAERLGLLCAEMHAGELIKLGATTSDFERDPVTAVDLARQRVARGSVDVGFVADPLARRALLEGVDLIDITLRYSEQVARFQQRDREQRPWIHDTGLGQRV